LLVLGIDTSCDDTSASLLDFKNGSLRVLTNIVSSQAEIHKKYGGIVPELASRRHIEMIWPVVNEALAGRRLEELSGIAVCAGPGLIGSLLVGVSFGKAVSWAKKIPLAAVNHLEGHILSAFLEEKKPDFPFIALIVSGGHTSLYKVDGFLQYSELGRTRDDAAGEAYDKVAKLLGLGYPGGPKIDALASEGDPKAVAFPRAYLPSSFDFSFSGLKTAVVNYIREEGRPEPADLKGPANLKDFAASFQAAVTDVLVRKCEWTIRKLGIKTLVVAGGVASNKGLRAKMEKMAAKKEIPLFIPSPVFCTDNAAMIAVAGYQHLKAGLLAGPDLNPKAYLKLG
jgi:N6-L-threonylcarbamoyladenine synthase